MRQLSSFILLFSIALTSCGQSNNDSKSKPPDSISLISIQTIRADFAKILPNQIDIITDLSKRLSSTENKSLDSIWQNYYDTAKKGIATMILDSGRIKEADFIEFSQAIYDNWIMNEKAVSIFAVVSPSLKKAQIFVGNSLSNILSKKDSDEIISNVILPGLSKETLYVTIKNMQLAIIAKIRQNGG